jgi:putative membrane-bound dehydrogenase-like protein
MSSCFSCARFLKIAGLLSIVALGHPSLAPAQKVPPGFKSELVLAAPEIEHPSVVTCDEQGNLFVGEDPMDMRGPTTKEFDRVLMITWNPDGSVARKTVFCDQLSAVFGLVWYDGALYVMHAPHYSRFKDTDGDGVADVREDLAEGFGPPAGVFGFNDHIVTGTRLGLDGLIYVSVGDKGVPEATGADGSTITLEGGGVVRMRPDGTQLEIFSSGTRNHLDVAMDSLDNIFTYDNTDDGLGWWTRFTHHIETGYYGYPYDYHPHPDRHLPRISEHGGGSPVGAACYREAAWPEQYRDSAFHCEWGKGKVQRFALKKSGASFTAEIEDFMVKDGSGEFRPQDLCFSPDGKYMYVADWNFAGWTRPDRVGRLFRVSYVGGDVPPEPPRAKDSDPLGAQLKSLGHPSHRERMRAQHRLAAMGKEAAAPLSALLAGDAPKYPKVHAIWAQNALIDRVDGYDPSADWRRALHDADADVRGQAARALGYRRVKIAVADLIEALKDPDASVRLKAAVALGRIGDAARAAPLFEALEEQDVYARFAMIQALRRINRWESAANYLSSPNRDVRQATLLAMTGVYDLQAVEALAAAAAQATDPEVQAKALEALGEVDRQADPYTGGWWGTRPAAGKPARSKKHEWSGTVKVLTALRAGLKSPAADSRIAAIRALGATGDREALPTVRELALGDVKLDVRREAMQFIAALKDDSAISTLAALAAATQQPEEVRQEAVKTITAIGSASAVQQLTAIVADDRSSKELTSLALTALGSLKAETAAEQVERRLSHASPEVRIKAIEAYAAIRGAAASDKLIALLKDDQATVKQATLKSLGSIRARDAVPAMAAAASDDAVRFEAISALAQIPDRRALSAYLSGLIDKNQTLREQCRRALVAVREEVAEDIIALNQRNELTPAVRGELQVVYSTPAPITRWQAVGAWLKDEKINFNFQSAPLLDQKIKSGGRELSWREISTDDPHGQFNAGNLFSPVNDVWAAAYTTINASTAGPHEFVIGSDDQAVLYVNGVKAYEFLDNRGWSFDQARVKADLVQGENHIWLLTGNTGGGWQFSVNVSHRDPRFAFLDENLPQKLDASVFRDFALKEKGDAVRGQKLFADIKGIGCLKCHAVGGQGGMVGPDLIGVGAKYPREELIRSVLEPSNRVADGFRATTIITAEGKVLQGLVKSDTDAGLELLDAEGKLISIPADQIDERETSNLSLMPNGLKDGMTLEDFANIVAYLESLKQPAK